MRPGRNRPERYFHIPSYSLPRGTRTRVESLVMCGAGSFTHVLRGRDVRNSLWETRSTLPRSVGIGADPSLVRALRCHGGLEGSATDASARAAPGYVR